MLRTSSSARRQPRSLRLAAAAISLALVAAACGSDDDSSSETTAAPADDGTDTTAAPAPSGDVTDVNVWIAFTDNRLDWTQEVAEEFNSQLDGYQIVVQAAATTSRCSIRRSSQSTRATHRPWCSTSKRPPPTPRTP